jgi:hypothetical protein
MQERRENFRIASEVLLSVRKVAVHRSPQPDIGSVASDQFQLWQQLSKLSHRRRGLLQRMRPSAPQVADYLGLLEEHLGLLTRTLVVRECDFDANSVCSPELSASGAAFNFRERLEPGQPLELSIGFLSTLTFIRAQAVTLRCELAPRGQPALPHRIAVEFQDLEPYERDQIAKYVLRAQIEARMSSGTGTQS